MAKARCRQLIRRIRYHIEVRSHASARSMTLSHGPPGSAPGGTAQAAHLFLKRRVAWRNDFALTRAELLL